MKLLLTAALEIQSFCQCQGWQMCVIGGLAVLRWGRPRTTQDVDISLLAGFGNEAEYVDPLIEAFATRLTDARQFALERRVLLLRAANQVPLDVSLAALPFEERVIARATFFEFSQGCSIRTASAEDLVALKAFANRPQDWLDIDGILVRQAGQLDWSYLVDELTALSELSESPEIVDRVQRLRSDLEGA
jgi:hypothetical protein